MLDSRKSKVGSNALQIPRFKDELPIRAELLGVDQLENRANELSLEHKVAGCSRRGKNLLERLADNNIQLVADYEILTEAAEEGEPLSPAAEWFIDNFHIVEEQLREVRQDLPRSFYRELPKLAAGEYENYPRIFQLAIELIAHSDNKLESSNIESFIKAYQSNSPLNMGELWALPISLRLGLIENLRRYADQIVRERIDRARAEEFADRLTQAKSDGDTFEFLSEISKTIEKMNDKSGFSPTLVAQIAARLRDGNRVMTFALEKIEGTLRSEGETIEHLTHLENNRQAADQVSVANIITSMRLLSTLDWKDFFERVSLVDRILQGDPAGAYSLMDFSTRDNYRHNIERIAKTTGADEIEIARHAIGFSMRSGETQPENQRQSHVGYFLNTIEGLEELENDFGYRPRFTEAAGRFIYRYPSPFYLFAIGLLTVIFTVSVTYAETNVGEYSFLIFAMILLLAITPAGELATTIVNWTVTLLLKPRHLAKMNFKDGIPKTARTIVVIPTLLSDEKTIRKLFERLEIYHLANRDENIFFSLLGDLNDAETESKPDDENLREIARECCKNLNEKFKSECLENPRFLFFSRKREWNEGEDTWICHERKRGNLHEFNRLLRGANNTDFDLAEAPDFNLLQTIRYVITLDADTQLPRDAARKLVGTIEHPLNRPLFDKEIGRVTAGYGILQPRIEVSLTSAARSAFARIYSAGKGFDPYTTAVSDVYQDLFGEGSYVGKGLYDVDAFEAALDRRIPENKLLSHDLFEGLYARVALVTDIVFYDDYPSGYYSFTQRLHRWTRGDWQITRWLLPFVPDADGKTVRNRLPIVARWKILENLRRSLVAFSLLVWLIFAWTVLPLSPLISTLFAVIALTAPLYLQIAATPLEETTVGVWQGIKLQLINLANDLKFSATQLFLRFTFLAHEAFTMLDAIMRVLYRKFVSGKHLLEWVTAAEHDRERRRSLSGYYNFMLSSPFFAFVILAGLLYFQPENMIYAAPFLLLWLFAPIFAFRLSSLTVKQEILNELDEIDVQWLRLIARKTWRFFEHFVGEGDHWLPPDNFQHDPFPITAHRTSPTNIGLLLLSTISARDFGYLGTLETIERIELTCMTLERLPRFRGHFYNWYDTKTLDPLSPHYVSTVDSGNLAGCLIAVAEGCREFDAAALFGEKTLNGFSDTLALLKSECEKLEENLPLYSRILDVIDRASQVLNESVPEWNVLFETLTTCAENIRKTVEEIKFAQADVDFSGLEFWVTSFQNLCSNYSRDLEMLAPVEASPEKIRQAQEMRKNFRSRIDGIAGFCRQLVDEMDFQFLYDEERKVLTIGYRPTEGIRDSSFYDLLASEARVASYLAIASGDVDQEHWFRLGRGLVSVNSGRALVSWSGTMFEYLMPLLLMRNYKNTLLSETYNAIISQQIEYGRKNNVAWGVSESAYNARDLQLNYQYGPFGVPGLGLKRGLADNLVVSPYATVLAIGLEPFAAVANLRRLEREGMLGQFGFYEAVDYTKERLPRDRRFARIESVMAHHQGMTLVALGNLLHKEAMVHRFHRDPMVESAELLLQERIPRLKAEAQRPRATAVSSGRKTHALVAPVPRLYKSGEQFSPPVCLLSNGHYTTMLTTAGSGYSRAGNVSITRWREDTIRDNWGQFFYLCDVRSGAVWSSGLQPVLREPQEYEAIFSESKVDFSRRDVGILTKTEIVVATEDDVEIRRITLTNESTRTREIEVTSYSEVVLNEQSADEAHPAFTNLFVNTEYDQARRTILACRRPRSAEDKEVWAAHTLAFEGFEGNLVSFETDRSRFIGRGRTSQKPSALSSREVLSGTCGATLDPIFALRTNVSIKPETSVSLIFSTISAESRQVALEKADKYRQPNSFERAMNLSWTRSQVELRHLGISTDEANLFQRLAKHLIYANPLMRPRDNILRLNRGTPQTLWKYGISGDLPIMIVRVDAGIDLDRNVSQILRAHEFLRRKGLVFDLVFFNDQPTTYAEGIREDLLNLIRRSAAHSMIDKRGGIFIRRSDEMPDEDRLALHAAARICFVTERGSLEEQLARLDEPRTNPPVLIPRAPIRQYKTHLQTQSDLQFFNDIGGFSEDGKEYVIALDNENYITPAPWSNVIANERGFGFIASESGVGMVWSQNSRENRLTSWSNDAVCNQPSACIYLRDEVAGNFWTTTPLPIRESSEYTIRHGCGYTIYENSNHGIGQELLVFAANDAGVKISRLRLKNLSDEARELSATFYCDLVLGVERAKNAPFIITNIDPVTGAIFARNPYNTEFSDRVAFIASDSVSKTWTCDRREFLGRNGNMARPAAMLREKLSGTSGAGLNPCAAIQTKFQLSPNETRDIIFLLGEEESIKKARENILHFRQKDAAEAEFTKVVETWDKTVEVIKVKTPDRRFDLMVNRWLTYQTLSCRFWARSSIYQSSGAYGFRDQLQDAMSLVYSKPDLSRKHILHAASRQFKEGDVQHWWHEPSGAGTRTRISDNLLWLVLVSCFYAEKTGDEQIFEEMIAFLDAPVLADGEQEVYLRPVVSDEFASLFEHCVRAVEKSMALGAHGLPLIGAGDWSDGLNFVGVEGRGESVWMGWFLAKILNQFSDVCERRGEKDFAKKYRRHAKLIQKNVEANGWDGNWYLRAFFDDGTPLGSKQNDECRIDSLPQSWSIISGLGDAKRSEKAIESVEKHLIKKDEQLALLLTPPFEKTDLEPGYIKGYPPGIRENGGQYTHAATWMIIAYALSGNGDKAYELFSMLNPINHARTTESSLKYKTEPYSVAADIYSHPQHLGRGGWTWYTGAAGWMYQAAVEYILGFKKHGDRLSIEPCLPKEWNVVDIEYRFMETIYRITIDNPEKVAGEALKIELDGAIIPENGIPLINDQAEHFVKVTIGAKETAKNV